MADVIDDVPDLVRRQSLPYDGIRAPPNVTVPKI
jgi:hypothetical protein